ncbi:hypothetical protein JJL45_05220 [Tamlana sp. s12]|uniref:hypothetical protein n=1 Tax=Tamlana sp. s12 TaxID=1630406 RepID=UPI0008016618|nr:hypothetical protein [Tamlana sp. s12]OBQ56095.1 hypothetical protein VQ01_06840 [Tamlana sp. s12]QQY83392.1 hypothetical protein JJL45_05220 [Tamlana sp. s12]
MSYIKLSVPRATGGTSPGAYKAKKPNVAIVDADDILSYPGRDSKGVNVTGSYVLKANANMIRIYMTPETIEASFESEGPEDGKVFKQMFKGEHPGETLEIREFIQNWLGRPVIVFEENCRDNTMNVYGTQCSPLKLNPSFTSNKEGTKHTISFEQPNPVEYVPGYYTGALTFTGYATPADENLDLLVADGNIYKLPSTAVTASIDVASIDLEHGEVVTLIGGGGAGALTLANGAGTAATIVLSNGTTWTALDDAVINLKVFNDGTTVYLIEESRH